jgi:N-methylhydantoinase A
VTDANVVLGRLGGSLLDGELALDRDAAARVIEAEVSTRLGITVEAAALGILAVVNAEMVRGIRKMSIARGWDPRDLTLVAFGGAGPLHAVDLARELDIEEVVVPAAPGATSAIGLLGATLRREFQSAIARPIDKVIARDMAGWFAGLDGRARTYLQFEHVPQSAMRIEHFAHLS